MTSDLATVDPERARLRQAADEALSALEPKERTFVETFLADGNASDAARAAGYRDAAKQALRIRRRPHVRAAIAAVLRCRTAEQELTRDTTISFLREMLGVRLEDACDLNERGVVVGLKDPSSLPTAVSARIKRAFIHTHASATGERAHYRKVTIEFTDALAVIDRLARLEGWVDDSPQVRIALSTLQPARVDHSASLALLHEMAGELLQGERRDQYLRAYIDQRQDEMVRLLREGARELAAAASATPVLTAEVSHE